MGVTDPESPGRLVRGVVEDADGRGLPGVRLRFEGTGDEATTGPDGSFALRGPLGVAHAALRLTDRGRDREMDVGLEAEEPLRVVAVGTDAVPLRVLTPATAPVPRRFGWQALARGPAGLAEGPRGEASGPRFAADGLAPGTWAIVVWAGPFLPVVVEPVVLDGRVSHPLVTVELWRRGACVAGRVFTATGAARAGVRVRVTPEDPGLRLPEVRSSATSDTGGRWRVEGLPAGRYVVRAEPDAGEPLETPLTLLDREERVLDLALGR